jgi:hypothetical protein
MDRYLYINSNESNTYFSDNHSYRFKVHLSLPLPLNGNWKIALLEFYATEDSSKPKPTTTGALYIYTDLCKESIVRGIEQPLLRRLKKNKRNSWEYMLDNPYYLPVKRKELREFEIYIKAADGSLASQLKDPLHLTLHLKQYPYL